MPPDSAATHATHDVLPGWALFAIYAAGFVITTRIVFAMSDGEDRGDDRLMSVCVGLIWPIVLAVVAVWALLALPTLGAKTKEDRRERAAAAERERKRLAARTAELEAENDRLRAELEAGDA